MPSLHSDLRRDSIIIALAYIWDSNLSKEHELLLLLPRKMHFGGRAAEIQAVSLWDLDNSFLSFGMKQRSVCAALLVDLAIMHSHARTR